ncbi:MAG: hypothetical protein OH333_00890 [Candidatus Parvarchaeota archaeon]|nr:hypothetical protein [Candidatus Jingweiarchaeum tengchongense]
MEFTGNWFIDAGILGFVNLMEEVYKREFDEIVTKPIQKEEFYYAYFVYYIKKKLIDLMNSKNFGDHNKQLIEEIRKLDEAGNNFRNDINWIREQIKKFNKSVKDKIEDIKDKCKHNSTKETNEKNNKKDGPAIIMAEEPFFKNLNFRNPSINRQGREDLVLKSFEEMIYQNKIKKKLTTNALDKTISKYLFSEEEFPNMPYCKPLTLEELDKITNQPSIVFLLSFPMAFNKVFDRYILFYTNDLESSYHINKSIKFRIERAKNIGPDKIFKISWQSVIDYLVTQESISSLENMYLIEYKKVLPRTQELINVEYIGIQKLQASILLDDTIRNNLNKIIIYGKDKYYWIIEEFIKGKPLYSILLNYINIFLNKKANGKAYLSKNSFLYSLMLEANILEFRKEKELKNKNIFSENYFDNYKFLNDEIKRDINFTSFNASLINRISEDVNKKNEIARELLNALKIRNKNIFLNILLKNMNEVKELCANPNLNKWIFNKIIKNDVSFEMYGLTLIMNLLGGENEQ